MTKDLHFSSSRDVLCIIGEKEQNLVAATVTHQDRCNIGILLFFQPHNKALYDVHDTNCAMYIYDIQLQLLTSVHSENSLYYTTSQFLYSTSFLIFVGKNTMKRVQVAHVYFFLTTYKLCLHVQRVKCVIMPN